MVRDQAKCACYYFIQKSECEGFCYILALYWLYIGIATLFRFEALMKLFCKGSEQVE